MLMQSFVLLLLIYCNSLLTETGAFGQFGETTAVYAL